jgi:hypothetical protein
MALSDTATKIASLANVRDGVERAEGIAALHFVAARRLLIEQQIPDSSENVLRAAQIVATAWAGCQVTDD